MEISSPHHRTDHHNADKIRDKFPLPVPSNVISVLGPFGRIKTLTLKRTNKQNKKRFVMVRDFSDTADSLWRHTILAPKGEMSNYLAFDSTMP